MNQLPGNTQLPSEEYSLTTPPVLTNSKTKPIIILGSQNVNEKTLFQNGLTQNIVFLYDLFECLGYEPYLLQVCGEQNDFLSNYRTIEMHQIVIRSMPISIFIEIGLSLDSYTKIYLQSIQTKVVKLYLGNILNIDIETSHCYNNNVFFHHHMTGNIENIWTSPHYAQHLQYAAIINRIPIKNSSIVPYVWNPYCFTYYQSKESMNWVAPTNWTSQDIVICDPNISFQKCTFYSLLLAEAFSNKFPEWKGHVHVINGDRLILSSHTMHNVLPLLRLCQSKRVTLHPRKKIHTIMKDHPSACFITHQWNNSYNYMTLELLYCNYPVLHNSDGWEPYGYHYSLQAWDDAIQKFYLALTCHKNNMNLYKTHVAQLIWKHSIYNPDMQERWRNILAS